MSLLTAKSFIFDGKSSDDFNLMIAWIGNSDVDISENGLNLSLQKTNNKLNRKTNTYGVQSENIVLNFSIVKKDCSEITRLQSIQINEWLTSSSTSQPLAFNDNDSYPLHYYAVCTQIEDIIIGGKLIGKQLKFENNSPFAFSEKMIKHIEVTNSRQISINNSSNARNNIIYPKVTISTSSPTIVLENKTDKKSVTIKTDSLSSESDGNKHIKIDSYNMMITDKQNKLIPAYKIGWNEAYKSYVTATDDNITNIYWLRFLRGINELLITGSCKMAIEYEFPRKAGCL